MPGPEALLDTLLALSIVALLAIRVRAQRADRDVPVAVAISTGVVLGIVAVFVTMIPMGWALGAT